MSLAQPVAGRREAEVATPHDPTVNALSDVIRAELPAARRDDDARTR
jgi:hypothetical protein